MILHGIEAVNLVHANTLKINQMMLRNAIGVDVVLANPPFGGRAAG